MLGWHLSRGWHGDPEWFMDCCPHEPCGFYELAKITPGCPNHDGAKTIRNSHPAEECPYIKEKNDTA